MRVGPFRVDEGAFSVRALARIEQLSRVMTADTLRDLHAYTLTKGAMSLRLIDWFCTNYCKANGTSWPRTDGTGVVFGWHVYREWLQQWNRPMFDCFRRGTRMEVVVEAAADQPAISFCTTLGQLNFMHFAVITGVLQELQRQRDAVARTKAESMRNNKKRKKRTELSSAPAGTCLVHRPAKPLRTSIR